MIYDQKQKYNHEILYNQPITPTTKLCAVSNILYWLPSSSLRRSSASAHAANALRTKELEDIVAAREPKLKFGTICGGFGLNQFRKGDLDSGTFEHKSLSFKCQVYSFNV
jgi:hypothetical protein